MHTLELHVNGQTRRIEADPDTPLLWVLRDQLGLTGTKYGCGEGVCGACTVLIDGKAVQSCTETVSAAAGKEITTIEGLARNGAFHPVQKAFLDKQAFQCGYCTPGMIIAAAALLDEEEEPDAASIKRSLEGHICRCGTYPRIVEAVQLASREGRDA